MVGGGRDAFIGAVHRMAATMDGEAEMVSGAFSSTAEKSKVSGEDLYLNPERVYDSYQEMAEKEAQLPEGERIDFVSVVTPNILHAPVSRVFLEAGFHVVCDKPMSISLEEALELREVVRKSGKVFMLTHNYTGYPMVKEARHLVISGQIGEVLKVVAEYPSDWLLSPIELKEQKQAAWRTDPRQSGVSNCMADIGTHAENLTRYITGLKIDKMCADFGYFIGDRELEDDGNLLVHFQGGAKGIMYASQISAGEANNCNIRVYGAKAGLEWHQEHPNELMIKYPDQSKQIVRRGYDKASEAANRATRLPPGHPEAFIEGFANIYLEAFRAIRDYIEGKFTSNDDYDYPNVDDGVLGMAFIETSVKSANSGEKWTDFPQV